MQNFYEQVLPYVDDMEVAGFPVKVLSLAQLIVTKEAAGREKDLAVLPVLKATLGKLQEGPGDVPPGA